jgi:hypothetical protein
MPRLLGAGLLGAGLLRGDAREQAEGGPLNAVFAAAIWVGLRPRGRTVHAFQAAPDAVSAAPAARVRSADTAPGNRSAARGT